METSEKKRIKELIDALMEPSSRYSKQSSYAIKGIFERIEKIYSTNAYISNDDMKEIMSEMGYVPSSNEGLDPRYKIRFKPLL